MRKKRRCYFLNNNQPKSLTIGTDKIYFSEKAKNLGIYFDSDLSMNHHMNNLCKNLYLQLRRIGHLASFLNLESLKTLVSAFIFSKIDYCNS